MRFLMRIQYADGRETNLEFGSGNRDRASAFFGDVLCQMLNTKATPVVDSVSLIRKEPAKALVRFPRAKSKNTHQIV